MGARPSSFTLTSPGPVRLYSTAELLNMKPPEWLIEGILPAGGLVGIYGPPGVKKSFVVMDIVLSIASDIPWQGHTVVPGYPLYIVAEGMAGMGKRVKAWLIDRKVSAKQAQVAWLPEAVPVHKSSTGVDAIIDRIHNEVNRVPNIVVIDTLARCFDGDENTQADMGRFIAGADQIRNEFGATVIIVHHTRLDATRERGNTAFRGAADTMIRLENRKGSLMLSCDKQKDAEEFEEMELRTRAVPEADSIVISNTTKTLQKLTRINEVLEILRSSPSLTWDTWYQKVSAMGVSKTSFNRYLVGLRDSDKILKENGVYRVAEGV